MNANIVVKNSPFSALAAVKSALPTAPVAKDVKEVDAAARDHKVRNVISTALKGAGVPVAALEAATDDMLAAFVAATGGKPKNAQVAEAALRTPQGKAELAALAVKYRPVQVVAVAKPAPEVPAQAPAKKVNNLLPEVEEQLHAQLLAAVQSGDDLRVDDALQAIVAACDGLFVTRFQNWTRVSGLLIGRLNVLGLRFRLEWTEAADGGLGSDVLPKKPTVAAPAVPAAPQGLVPEEEEELTVTLRSVMRDGTQRQLEEAVRALVDVCRSRGVTEFATPYKPHAFASNLLMKAWNKVKREGESFWFHFPANGLDMEVEEDRPQSPARTASRLEAERRRQANRSARLAAQPRKGPTGIKPDKRMPKK